MSLQISCLLCHNKDTHITQTIKQKDISQLYHRALNINVEHIITSDLLYHHCPKCDLRFFTCADGSIPTGDNAFYNALNQLEWYYFAQKHEYHYVKNFIAPDSRVLEVGCGKAAFAHFLPQQAKQNYVGLEFSTKAKEMAARDGIAIENIAIEEFVKTHPESFDVACSFQVLEHVSNPYTFIKAQVQALRSDFTGGGSSIISSSTSNILSQTKHNATYPLLVIAIPSEESFIRYAVNGILNMPPHHVLRLSDKTLHAIADLFNLQILDIYHEQVQPEHFEFYKSTMWAKLFLPTPLVDRSIFRKIINRLGYFGRNFIKIPSNAYGHTVVAIYTLKNKPK